MVVEVLSMRRFDWAVHIWMLFVLLLRITHAPICPALCKLRFSLDTWRAFAMASFSCLGLLDSVLHSFLSDTFMVRLSVSSKTSYWTSLYSNTFYNIVRHFAVEEESEGQ